MAQDDTDKEKESIEEILGDLNALLNKMPAILSDIKMPEIKPVEIPPLSDVSPAVWQGDLAEGGSEGGGQAEEKTESEPVEIEKSKLEIESLADSIVEEMQRQDEVAGTERHCPSRDSAGRAAGTEQENEPQQPLDTGKQNGSKEYPEFEFDLSSEASAGAGETDVKKEPVETEQEKLIPQRQPGADSFSGQTADVAVPDIDDLLNLSSESSSVREDEPKGVIEFKNVQIAFSEPDVQAGLEPTKLEEQIQQQGGEMSLNENSQEDKEIKKEPEQRASGSSSVGGIVPRPEQTPQEKEYMETIKLDPSELEFKAMADEPVAKTGQDSEGQGELQDKMETGPGESMEQSQALGEQTPSADGLGVTKEDISAQPAETMPESLEVKASQQEVVSALEMPAVSGGIEIQKKIDLNPVQTDFGQTLPGVPNGLSSEALAKGEALAQADQGGESAPQEAAEEKTVMWSGQDPSLTSRIQLEDINLDDVSSKTPPESIPSERVKTLAFLYSMGDEKLCASMLAKIDSICLKSRTKPMFVKRSFVRVFEPDMKGSYLLELASQSACSGVVCVGNIPHENVYDIENSFNSSNLFFRHISYDNFTHPVMVDMIADLILL
ncbi:MAG: hypothetical protein HY746_07240 [Elusimicrobia bacterium]|nr:hypothetical protein [Elusimicrobiota bacterium]